MKYDLVNLSAVGFEDKYPFNSEHLFSREYFELPPVIPVEPAPEQEPPLETFFPEL